MLAIDAMSPTVTAILWFVALVLFVCATFNVAVKVNLIAAGLAVGSLIFFWAALARA